MSVPAVVAQAASMAARDRVGIVGYRLARTLEIAAGPYHRHENVAMVAVFRDDTLVAVRVLRHTVNGREATAQELHDLENQLTSGSKTPGFAVPFDSRYFADYTYTVAGSRVSFTSTQKDARHGNGFFDVGKGGAVTQMQYTPNVLPRYATTATVRDERGEVLPNFWATVKSTSSYGGRYLFFSGHAETVMVESDFHRFGSVEAGKAWLQAER